MNDILKCGIKWGIGAAVQVGAVRSNQWVHFEWKKRSEETQTLRAGCSKAEPKISPRHSPLPGGAGRPKFNQLEMVTTFTYKPSLVRIDARNFELSW